MSDDGTSVREILRVGTERIRADREQGASALALEAARTVAEATLAAATSPHPPDAAEVGPALYALAYVRPSMAAITNTIAALWQQASDSIAPGIGKAPAVTALHSAALELVQRWQDAPERILRAGESALGGTLLTFSRSGTVETVLQRLAMRQFDRRVVVLLSHPGDEGVALAHSLSGYGWKVTLIADAAASLQLERVAAVVVGADTIRADGTLVNKVGTYPLALLAREFHVPMYVLAETLKIAASEAPLALEEMPAAELLPEPVEGIEVQNVYFDQTPRHLITAIFTEDGLMTAAAIGERAARAQQALHVLASLGVATR